MTNFLSGGSGRVNNPQTTPTALRIQSAVNGQPIPIVHGQQRIAGNLVDYDGFTATAGAPPSSGKGGTLSGGSKGASQGYTYSADVLLGLCEGPIYGVLDLWNNQTPDGLPELNFTQFPGSIGQAPWSFWQSQLPAKALGYSGLAYVGANPVSLGQSAELPNLNWEVRGEVSSAVIETGTVAAPSYAVTAAYFSLAASITEQVVVPYLAPYAVVPANIEAAGAMATALSIIDGAEIINSNSCGVVYTLTGAALTRVSGAPSAGQYQVVNGSPITFYFSAADAGAEITIIDLAVGPGVSSVIPLNVSTIAGERNLYIATPFDGVVPGAAVTGPAIPAGTIVEVTQQPGSFVGNLTAGNEAVDYISGAVPTFDQVLADSAGVLPAGTYVSDYEPATQTFNEFAVVSATADQIGFTDGTVIVADLTVGQATLANVSVLSGTLADGLVVAYDYTGAVYAGWTLSVTPTVVTLSAAPTGNAAADTMSYGGLIGILRPATATGSETVTVSGQVFTQVLAPPAQGEFALSAAGVYTFNPADAGASVIITDVPDADPAASLSDFLSNPRYGCGFPAAYLGDLTLLQDYAFALGLFISPAIVSSQAANQYLDDFSTGLNGEFVWSSGLLTFVPYGDQTISGNGRTYTPPSASGPIYSLGEDDYLPNEGTSSIGVSAFTSDDPVVCVRKRQSDALNDVKVEYLDRGNAYNPAIVEAQDDAAINQFGLRPADTKALHFFCIEAAALVSAQLQLGRQQIRNQYSFTVPWHFILLDPMDVIAISDAGLGLESQLVRIAEITENQQDWSLTITAEEVLDGTGSTPRYGSQPKTGYLPNYNADPGQSLAPLLFEPPFALYGNLEVRILTAGAGAYYGGCDVYVSGDGETYKLLGRAVGSARVGATTANYPSGSDPDTVDTLAVQLFGSQTTLIPGTDAQADASDTLCIIGGLPAPASPTLGYTPGGSLSAASCFVRITYEFAGGIEGPASAEESIAVPAGNLLTVASPAAIAGATGWQVYVGAVSGGETSQSTAIALGTAWTEPAGGLVNGAAFADAATGYELTAYSSAVLTGAGAYQLGSYVRRGCYATTISDHPLGSFFGRLDASTAILSYQYDPSQIGRTLYVKLVPVNLWQSNAGYSLADVPAYPYQIAGPPPPGPITGFSAQQSGGAVTFSWTPLGTNRYTYDILFGPQGGTVAAATLLTKSGAGAEMTNAGVPPGTWTFYIRGRDPASQSVGPVTAVDLVVANVNALIATATENPDWLGSKSGFLLHHSGVLVPDSTKLARQLAAAELFEQFVAYPAANPTYAAPVIDTGFNGNFRVWAIWSAMAGGDSAGENAAIAFALASWQTGASDPGVYTPWGPSGYAVDQRYVVGQITENTATPASVSALSVAVDNPVGSYSVTDFTVGAGGTMLVFAAAAGLPAQFHVIPNVQVTPTSSGAIGGGASAISATSCFIQLFDSAGAAVAGTANVTVTGP